MTPHGYRLIEQIFANKMITSEKFQSTNNPKLLEKEVLLEIRGRVVRMNTFSGKYIIFVTIFCLDSLKIKKKNEMIFLCTCTRKVFSSLIDL